VGMDSKQIKVVIADDHAKIRAAMRKYLERATDVAVVGEAGNGEEAVELVEALDPDILILDLEMPVMGGVEALKLLKRKHCDVSVLILSAYDDKEYAPVLKDLGAAGYLMKGEPLGLIMSMVRDLARGGRAMEQYGRAI
jgi:DNA-binding NarL/FixJ family response regulator